MDGRLFDCCACECFVECCLVGRLCACLIVVVVWFDGCRIVGELLAYVNDCCSCACCCLLVSWLIV